MVVLVFVTLAINAFGLSCTLTCPARYPFAAAPGAVAEAATLPTVAPAAIVIVVLVANANCPSLVPANVPAAIVNGTVSAPASVNCKVVTAGCEARRVTLSS